MITENTKTIFRNAAKKTEAFAREAISVFPKIKINENISNKELKKFIKINKGKV
jgi:hypothetical protein